MCAARNNLFGIKAPFFTPKQFERIASEALNRNGLMPEEPSPVQIEIFAEQEWDITEEPADLPEGVLGCTRFNRDGVSGIMIARFLMEATDTITHRRCRSTQAHEIAHGLLHAPLFVQLLNSEELQENHFSTMNLDQSGLSKDGFMCRDVDSGATRYNSPWYEVQANRLMSSLLLPWQLVTSAAEAHLKNIAAHPDPELQQYHIEQAESLISQTFDVSRRMVQIRLEGWWQENLTQPTLF